MGKGSRSVERGALSRASHNGQTQLVLELITGGADPNELDKQGVKPLHAACRRGHLPTARALLEARADVNAKSRDGDITPLGLVARQGRVDMVLLLLDSGADVDSRDCEAQTALLGAASEGWGDNEAVIRLILAAGANVLSRDVNGVTPLMGAARNGRRRRAPVVRALIEAGAHTRDGGGGSALRYASRNGDVETCELLLAAGVDRDARDDKVCVPRLSLSRDVACPISTG